MRNKVEILRSLCFTKEDFDTFKSLPVEFSDIEIEFMVEFKKIYEFGLNQLESFITKLDEEGKDLDEYSIQYYVSQLFNGPLGQYARQLSENKNYFSEITDIMGFSGNNQKSVSNITIFPSQGYPLGCNVDLYNKIPKFIQENLIDTVKQTEDFFRESLKMFSVYDNTLPLVDKKPQERYEQEETGEWVNKSIGNFMVKDSFFSTVQESLNSILFDQILDYLGEENSRIFSDKKTYNPFDPDKNDSTSSHYKLEKTITEGDLTEVIEVDLMRTVIDSPEKRQSVLKVPSAGKDKEYKLGTVEGQLGN